MGPWWLPWAWCSQGPLCALAKKKPLKWKTGSGKNPIKRLKGVARADIAPAPLGQQRLAYDTLVQQFCSAVNKSVALELSCWPTDENHRNNNTSEFQNWKTFRWFGLTREGHRGLESEVIQLNTRSKTWWSTFPVEHMTSQFILFASQRHLCSSDSCRYWFVAFKCGSSVWLLHGEGVLRST